MEEAFKAAEECLMQSAMLQSHYTALRCTHRSLCEETCATTDLVFRRSLGPKDSWKSSPESDRLQQCKVVLGWRKSQVEC